jgi:hypothetical protein
MGRRGTRIIIICGKARRKEITRKTKTKEMEWVGVDWLYLAQDRDQWRALLSTVMELRGP